VFAIIIKIFKIKIFKILMNKPEEKPTKKKEIVFIFILNIKISMDDQDNYGRRHWEVEEQEETPS
jgi:hypothetical protein